jgi:hypothetical protein
MTGSLLGTASYASISNIQYVTSSVEALSQIEVADYDSNIAVTFQNGRLKFIFGKPTEPANASLTDSSTFLIDRFNKVLDSYTLTGTFNNNGFTLISASLYTGSVLLTQAGSGDSLTYNITASGSQRYRLEVTSSSPLTGFVSRSIASFTGSLSKSNPSNPSISVTSTNVQLGATSNQIEVGATGSIGFNANYGSSNNWTQVSLTTTPSSSPLIITGSSSQTISATASYASPLGDNNPDLTYTAYTTQTYSKIRSVRYGSSTQTSFTENELQTLSLWDMSLGGNVGTIVKGTTNPNNYQFTVATTASYIYIVYSSAQSDLSGILNVNNSNSNDISVFTKSTVGSYTVYRSNNLSSTSILYKLTTPS